MFITQVISFNGTRLREGFYFFVSVPVPCVLFGVGVLIDVSVLKQGTAPSSGPIPAKIMPT